MVLKIFCIVQQASSTRYSNIKGQKTSICTILKYVHARPSKKAKVARSHTYISPNVLAKGLSPACYKPIQLSFSVGAWLNCSAKTLPQRLQASQSGQASTSSSLTPLGVKQPMSSCSRQNPMRQVTISRETDWTVSMQVTTRTQVIAQRSLRYDISLFTREQQQRRTLPIARVASIAIQIYSNNQFMLCRPPNTQHKILEIDLKEK